MLYKALKRTIKYNLKNNDEQALANIESKLETFLQVEKITNAQYEELIALIQSMNEEFIEPEPIEEIEEQEE